MKKYSPVIGDIVSFEGNTQVIYIVDFFSALTGEVTITRLEESALHKEVRLLMGHSSYAINHNAWEIITKISLVFEEYEFDYVAWSYDRKESIIVNKKYLKLINTKESRVDKGESL